MLLILVTFIFIILFDKIREKGKYFKKNLREERMCTGITKNLRWN